MKKIYSILMVAICGLFAAPDSSAITRAEHEAQTAVNDYVRSLGWEAKIDKSDNSVNFRRKDILYWITFEEKEKGILYTLHRKTIKMDSENLEKEKIAQRVEISVIASNFMNNKFPFKTFVNGSKVEFVFPVFAATPEDFNKVFQSMLNTMVDLQKEFDRSYDRAKLVSDSIHDYWRNNDPKQLVIPQPGNEDAPESGNNLTITSVDFKVVDYNRNNISGYGENIRKADIKFIQPMVKVQAAKKGKYEIGMCIYTPDGKMLVPYRGAKRTSVTTVDVTTKPEYKELNDFGDKDGTFWSAGEYKVVFYEDNRVIKETSFNVL